MAESDQIIQKLLLRLQGLSRTPYACSSWTKVSGGTTNFLYRGTLRQPLEEHDGFGFKTQTTIILKHATANVPGNEDFGLDVARCEFEEVMLHDLVDFSYTDKSTNTVVKTPRLYMFDRDTNTQILEDLNDTTDLKTILLSPNSTHYYPGSSSASLGHVMGSWLRSFHSWTSAPDQTTLQATIGRNNGMRKLKCQITYDSFLGILALYPQILGGHFETLQTVKDAMTAEFLVDYPPDISGEEWGLIHGDFWSGNILLPNSSSQDLNKLFIIDWEFAQFGHRAIDVGGMLADLYERKHFRDVDAVLPAMRGFAEGYGPISEDMAFRTCIHVGVHLICWHIRRNPNFPLPAPLDKVTSALALGRDFVLKGWEKDREWFTDSVLAPLFAVS